jgi:hypothetical protein
MDNKELNRKYTKEEFEVFCDYLKDTDGEERLILVDSHEREDVHHADMAIEYFADHIKDFDTFEDQMLDVQVGLSSAIFLLGYHARKEEEAHEKRMRDRFSPRKDKRQRHCLGRSGGQERL